MKYMYLHQEEIKLSWIVLLPADKHIDIRGPCFRSGTSNQSLVKTSFPPNYSVSIRQSIWSMACITQFVLPEVLPIWWPPVPNSQSVGKTDHKVQSYMYWYTARQSRMLNRWHPEKMRNKNLNALSLTYNQTTTSEKSEE